MEWIKKNALLISWTVALLAMLGSLYFQYVRGFPPCVLCWYQRIAMYPLVFILGAGIVRKSKEFYYAAMPIAVIGAVIALYHNLLYYNIIPEAAAPCTAGISCTTQFIEYFGFVTIPFLSLASFIFIIISLLIYRRNNNV